MKFISRFHFIVAAAVLAACALSTSAYADTQGVSGCSGCNGYTFQATLTPNGGSSYSLSYTITNVSGSPANAQSFSLTLFGNSDDIGSTFSNFTMSDGNTSAYTVLVGKSNNGNGDCNATISNALCVKSSGVGTLSTIGVGQSLTFNFDFTCNNCTELANWDFLAFGTCTTGNGNCYAISTNGTGVSVPEPSSTTFLVCTLLAAISGLAIPRVRAMVLPGQQSELSRFARTA
jgi:hypothetical protein